MKTITRKPRAKKSTPAVAISPEVALGSDPSALAAVESSPPAKQAFVLPPKVAKKTFLSPDSIIPGITWTCAPIIKQGEKSTPWHKFTLRLVVTQRGAPREFKYAQECETTPSMLNDAVRGLKVRLDQEAERAAHKAQQELERRAKLGI